MTSREFKTITGKTLVIELPNEGPCRHKEIAPISLDEAMEYHWGYMHRCVSCGMKFNAEELANLKES